MICHDCERPIEGSDYSSMPCPRLCVGGDQPYHYKCAMLGKKRLSNQHTPNARLAKREVAWAQRVESNLL